MKAVDELTDSELKAELATHGFTAPPITGTTKAILQKKLEAFRSGSDKITKPKSTAAQQRKNSPGRTAPAPTLAVTPAKAQPTSTIKAKNDTTFDGSLDYSRFQVFIHILILYILEYLKMDTASIMLVLLYIQYVVTT
jgi:hypothetical protein